MGLHTKATKEKQLSSTLNKKSVLSNNCTCGKKLSPLGECVECRRKQDFGKKELPVQAKLIVNKPGDQYEQEADRVADMVMRMPATLIQPKVTQENTKTTQIQSIANQVTPLGKVGSEHLQQSNGLEIAKGEHAKNFESKLSQSKGGGQPIAKDVRAFVEPRMQFNFSDVRIHTNEAAIQMNRDLSAKAFTNGKDIYFGAGQYNPHSNEGKHLLAHELVHVVQQNQPEEEQSDSRALQVQNGLHSVIQTSSDSKSDGMESIANEELVLNELIGLDYVMFNALANPAAFCVEGIKEIRDPLNHILSTSNRLFTQAWKRHNDILIKAKADAELENLVRGVVIGAVASVAVVAAIAAIPATSGLATFAAGWWGQAVGAGLSSAIGTGATSLLSASTNFTSVIPKELGQLQQLSQLYNFERRVNMFYEIKWNILRKYMTLSVVVNEIQKDPTSITYLQEEINQFLGRKEEIMSLGKRFYSMYEAITQLKDSLKSWKEPDVKQIEQAIWVHWIASLPLSKHNLLDEDVLEEYLHGSIGVLGDSGLLQVDTMWEFWDADKEKLAIARARERKDEVIQLLSISASIPQL